MPLKPERMEAVKQTLVNRINNDYPPFRNLSEKVASARMEGFDRDPAEEFLRDIATMDMQDIPFLPGADQWPPGRLRDYWESENISI